MSRTFNLKQDYGYLKQGMIFKERNIEKTYAGYPFRDGVLSSGDVCSATVFLPKKIVEENPILNYVIVSEAISKGSALERNIKTLVAVKP